MKKIDRDYKSIYKSNYEANNVITWFENLTPDMKDLFLAQLAPKIYEYEKLKSNRSDNSSNTSERIQNRPWHSAYNIRA